MQRPWVTSPAMTPLKVDVMLSNSVVGAARRAQELERTGVDGVFSFENAHDLFFPLVAAAPVCSLDLMTNVAIAFPRSPMHLANAAYDLHLLSEGRFRLGLGSQIKAHVERPLRGALGPSRSPRCGSGSLATKAILDSWQEGTRVDFRGEHTTHTLMTPAFNPGAEPLRHSQNSGGRPGPRMNEMAAEVADGILVMPFNSGRHIGERTMPAIDAGLATAGRTLADIEITVEVIVGRGAHRRGARGRQGRAQPLGLLRFDARLPAGARRRGLGRPAARAEHPVEAGGVAGDGRV